MRRQADAKRFGQGCQRHIHTRPDQRDERLVAWRWQARGANRLGLKAVEDDARYYLATPARPERVAQLVEQ